MIEAEKKKKEQAANKVDGSPLEVKDIADGMNMLE
jgi:hypothetical protein